LQRILGFLRRLRRRSVRKYTSRRVRKQKPKSQSKKGGLYTEFCALPESKVQSFLCCLSYPKQSSGDTSALLSSKGLAVSLPLSIYGGIMPVKAPHHLSEVGVTARTSAITRDGDYPLPFSITR